MRQAHMNPGKLVVAASAMLLIGPALVLAGDAATPSVTPQQLIDQVRAQQAAAAATGATPPVFASVPAPPANSS